MGTNRTWALAAVILAISGCPGPKPAPGPEPEPAQALKPVAMTPAPREKSSAIPQEVIDAIPGLVGGLKPGMTLEQVISALRLGDYEILNTDFGPPQKRRFRYYFGTRYALVLTFDCSKREEGEYLSASLWGEWRKAAEEAAAPGPDMLAAAAANMGFTADLFGRIRQRRGNLFLSPFSVFTALVMALTGARGKTGEEMAAVLKIPADRAKFRKALGDVIRHLNSRKVVPFLDEETPDEGKPEFEIAIANALFVQRGFSLLQEFADANRDDLSAGALELDFKGSPEESRTAINAWVLDKTRNRIADMLAPGAVSKGTRLAIASAIYFIAPWAIPFEESDTLDGDFRTDSGKTVRIPFMNARDSYAFSETESFRTLAIPYRGEDLTMFVVLPKAVDGLDAVEAGLDSAAISSILGGREYRNVDLSLPKFEIQSDFLLEQALSSMGIRSAFSPMEADFSGITGKEVSAIRDEKDLFISMVAHKAFVIVNEKGTEAAASTVEIMTASGMRENIIEFRADHPFLFFIADRKTKSLIFMGRVANPLK